jgi:hypothetical protein
MLQLIGIASVVGLMVCFICVMGYMATHDWTPQGDTLVKRLIFLQCVFSVVAVVAIATALVVQS